MLSSTVFDRVEGVKIFFTELSTLELRDFRVTKVVFFLAVGPFVSIWIFSVVSEFSALSSTGECKLIDLGIVWYVAPDVKGRHFMLSAVLDAYKVLENWDLILSLWIEWLGPVKPIAWRWSVSYTMGRDCLPLLDIVTDDGNLAATIEAPKMTLKLCL